MSASFGAAVAVACAACAPPDGAGRGDARGVGVTREAWCQGYVVDNVVAQNGTTCFVSPGDLAGAVDGWGPQLLALNVDQGFSPQVTYQESPSVSLEQDKVTASLQKALSFSLTQSVNISAATTVAVPTGAYYRIEAYPEYQEVDFDVTADPCGPSPGGLVTTGSAYRPVGVYFDVMDFVGGAWNALAPPSPAQAPDPAGTGAGGAGAGAGTGAGGSGGHP